MEFLGRYVGMIKYVFHLENLNPVYTIGDKGMTVHHEFSFQGHKSSILLN